ncbi:endolytic transglycosylase MltG [Candidatus Saccharibacteria bacterium]|nr:endolytic transglycosylase MltG [Candidatus Saccharibacteria bacterium]
MKGYKKKRPVWRSWPAIIITSILIIALGAWGVHTWYTRNLGPVDPASTQPVYFTVVSGSTVHEIGSDLKRANLIRSTQAFETYVRGKELFNKLQAGSYTLSKSMSTPKIVDKIVSGDVSKDLLTIPPGKTLKQIREVFKSAGYNDAELDIAFSPVTYAGHPALTSLPTGATLEGYLYPDSFQKASNTPPETIVRQSLDEMQKHLTPDIIRGFAAQGLSTYQGITMASIVYAESGDPASEPMVAQVFLLRLKQGIALGSDVTAFYAASQAGVEKTLGVDSPYNTRINRGIPPGPIGNFTDIALKAVAFPAATDYLFFVAGDDGVLHFTHTQAEHEQAIKQYCTTECS